MLFENDWKEAQNVPIRPTETLRKFYVNSGSSSGDTK